MRHPTSSKNPETNNETAIGTVNSLPTIKKIIIHPTKKEDQSKFIPTEQHYPPPKANYREKMQGHLIQFLLQTL